jgi:uncharacterized membrane protein YphA (DoxX/SURF4 family)
MSIIRFPARSMLASMFIVGGLDALRHPDTKVPAAESVTDAISDALPEGFPRDPHQLVMINGAVQLGAGVMLALGRLRRVSALVLAVSLIPTTLAAHRFWEAKDDTTKKQQMIHFVKNLSMLGGLLLAALDTEGDPSLRWRAVHATRRAADHLPSLAA